VATKIDDQLVKFLKRGRGRRRTNPSETIGYRPVKQGTAAPYRPVKQSAAGKLTRLAEDDLPDTRLIPGFGGVRQQREKRRAQARARPLPGSYQPGRRGQTKPTPGSYYGRKKPRLS